MRQSRADYAKVRSARADGVAGRYPAGYLSTSLGNLNLRLIAGMCPGRIGSLSLWHFSGYDAGRPPMSGW